MGDCILTFISKNYSAMGATGKAGNGKRETGNGTGTGNENLREAAGQRRLVALGYCLHESQGRVGLRTHGSLTLFMGRTRKNCGGEGTTINSIIVRVKYLFSSHYSQDCTLHAAQDLCTESPSSP